MKIPLICTTIIEMPMILQILQTRRTYIYDESEDRDREVIYLPKFEDSDSRKRKG